MWSTVLKLVFAWVCLALSPVSWGKEGPPRILREPLLGLRYDSSVVRFPSLPTEVRALCPTLRDTENIRGKWYIYGSTTTGAGESYYIAGGYSVRSHPRPPDLPEFELDDNGVIFKIEGGHCTVFEEAARAMFEPFLTGEIPPVVLHALANDCVARLVQAFGSVNRLEAAVQTQRIAVDKLPNDLRQAYRRLVH
jgi:hypothetical protein